MYLIDKTWVYKHASANHDPSPTLKACVVRKAGPEDEPHRASSLKGGSN